MVALPPFANILHRIYYVSINNAIVQFESENTLFNPSDIYQRSFEIRLSRVEK